MTYRLVIADWHPCRLNLLLDRWKGAKRKKADRELLAIEARRQGIPKATGKRRVTLTVVLVKGQRGADVDAYWKSCLDALRHARLLTDDNRQGVELAPVIYERGPRRMSIIELEDL